MNSRFVLSYLRQFSRTASQIEPVRLQFRKYDEDQTVIDLPPILVMHGVFACKRNWHTSCQNIHRKTQPRRKVIALDARNHGESPHTEEHSYSHMSADIVQFMIDHEVPQVSLLGHSMGGRAAMYMALENPKLVESLIVVDITPLNIKSRLTDMRPLFKALKQVELPTGVTPKQGRDMVRAQLTQIFEYSEVVEFMLMNLKVLDGQKFKWCVNFNALFDNYEHFGHFPIEKFNSIQYEGPMLLLASERSQYVPSSQIDGVRQYFPNLQVKYFDAGHNIHVEAPTEFLEAVTDFINNKV